MLEMQFQRVATGTRNHDRLANGEATPIFKQVQNSDR
jgi:hypothetical protein